MSIHIHIHQKTFDATELSPKEQQAKARVQSLKSKSKKEIFDIYTKTLGRIHSAQIGEQRQSWMIYDIIKHEYDKAIADKVAG